MCAEVNEGVCFETVLCPKIGSEIEMWGNCIYSMRYFELIISESCCWLWHNHHITKTKAGNAETTIFGGQVFSRERAVGFLYGFVVFGRQTGFYPSVELLASHHFRLTFLEESFHFSFIIGA